MNYRDWCEAMRIAPHFVLQATAPPDLYEETHQIEVMGLCRRLVSNLRPPPVLPTYECAHSSMESRSRAPSVTWSSWYSSRFRPVVHGQEVSREFRPVSAYRKGPKSDAEPLLEGRRCVYRTCAERRLNMLE